MNRMNGVALGLDYGTESVRAMLLDLHGRELGSASSAYRHGQILDRLPTTHEPLPPDFALQDPQDWIDSAVEAVNAVLAATHVAADAIIGIGVDFTSCTMLPTLDNGTPVCLGNGVSEYQSPKPKLGKHHGAKSQTDRINLVARCGNGTWLAQCGGAVGQKREFHTKTANQ